MESFLKLKGMQVSIIIPVYNVAPYIEKCLRTVMSQTYMGEMECLLIDDCGEDDSMAIANKIIIKYQQEKRENKIDFRFLKHDHNRGLSAARNTGIEYARGAWLYFLDSDDWIIPECIQMMMERVEKFPLTEAVFAGAINECRPWMDFKKKEFPEYSDDQNWIQESILRRTQFGMTAWNKLVKRTFIIENNFLFKEKLIHEDELWNFLLAQKLSHLSILKLNTYYYEDHPQSIVSEKKMNIIWDRRIIVWNAMIDEIKGCRVNVQVKAICRFILNLSTKPSGICFPRNKRNDLFLVYFRLAFKSTLKLSIFVLIQGLLALLYNRHYQNSRITRRIMLT